MCRPGRVAKIITYGDGEAAVVGAHQADDRPLVALNLEAGALAPILGPSLGRACKKKKILLYTLGSLQKKNIYIYC
jgi:hypothetical protein